MLAIVVIENGQKKYIPLTADAGAGNPVGTIIVVCSNRVPSNYLPLGTQFDTTQYPLLYAELGTDTTPTASSLNLPTLSSGQYVIKATSGLSENAQDNVINTLNEQRSYSTEEVNTGKKWIDGKPIYRKVVLATGSETLSTTQRNTIPAWSIRPNNVDKIIHYETLGIQSYYNNVILYDNPNDQYLSFLAVGVSVTVSVNDILILEYTKTV